MHSPPIANALHRRPYSQLQQATWCVEAGRLLQLTLRQAWEALSAEAGSPEGTLTCNLQQHISNGAKAAITVALTSGIGGLHLGTNGNA